MSTADQHRASALESLDSLDLLRNTGADDDAFVPLAAEATAHALLALDARLGELVEQQRLGNTIAALHQIGCYGDDEYMAARATVRAVLGLPPEGQSR
ncbi:hypothetical protein [Nocardia wallacei]|uniref:hypothetical protein n=1 Tax=Nocardia wallacei TaxID=480035 RepID=UPI002457943D|nr:hypothetical protein [Nocardia wallacei]